MKYKIMLAGVIFIIVIALFVGCARKEVEIANPNVTNGKVTLNSFVTDKDSKEPVEGAIVLLGGYEKCYTNIEGRCSITTSGSSGAYGLQGFKKEYNHSVSLINLKLGENNFTIELDKKPNIPESFVIEGKIIEIVYGKGTRGEDHIFKLIKNDGTELYIFDETGRNDAFRTYINKKVRITGFNDIGYIGWEHLPSEGIYVEEIKKI